jgi:hypothetical protein
MKARLMHPDRDFDPAPHLPPHARDLAQDLALGTLWSAMAAGDARIFDVAQVALLAGIENDLETIRYRQEIVHDCLAHPAVVRELYAVAVDAIERTRRRYYGVFGRYPSSTLASAIDTLEMLVGSLRAVRRIAEAQHVAFASRGFTRLFAMLQAELSDAYLAEVEQHLAALAFKRGVLLSAELGRGNAGTNYVLRAPQETRPRWMDRLLGRGPAGYTFRLHERDEAGARALGDLRSRGINLVANAAAQSADHIVSFFEMLRAELAFYVGCVNLHERLTALGAPTAIPRVEPVGAGTWQAVGLYDVTLALTLGQRVVGNTIDADGMQLVVITGANQGGKSSFLRSVGLAQLMMQGGMFVGAEAFAGALCTGLFTHYKREEDPTMARGKLDEELARLSEIVDAIGPHAILLCNESFAATNEREGSEIARQVVAALLEKHVTVMFVTHLYAFAHAAAAWRRPDALFLRAERLPDGTRTFRLVVGEPLETSYGEDVYRAVFAPETAPP